MRPVNGHCASYWPGIVTLMWTGANPWFEFNDWCDDRHGSV